MEEERWNWVGRERDQRVWRGRRSGAEWKGVILQVWGRRERVEGEGRGGWDWDWEGIGGREGKIREEVASKAMGE